MRALARWGALLALAAPCGAWALGLGDIELKSALNQPLVAEIGLVSATPEELEGLRVALAPREAFERYGLERPAFLSSLEFRVARNAQGRDVIVVTSRQSVSEPFLTLLIEATWPRGRLLREYTVLVDPPVLLPPAAEPVLPARTQPPQPGGAPIDRPQPRPAPAAGTAPEPRAATPAPRVADAAAGGTYGPVQRAETLWGIATRLQPADVSLNQMMVAVYEANPQAFDGNMNLLRAGAVLTIPDVAAVRRRNAAEATAEFRRHNDAWLAGAEEPRLRLLAAGSDLGQAAPAAGGAADGETARLREEVTSLRGELEEARRLLQVRDEQLGQLQARLSAADEPPATATEPPEEAPAAEPAPVAAAGVDLESERLFADEVPGETAVAPAVETPEQPAAAPPARSPVQVAAPPPEPSLVERLLSWLVQPMLWIALGVMAVLGAAVWFLRHRREDAEDVTGRWEALEAEVDDDIDLAPRELTDRLRRPPAEESIVVEERAPISQAFDRDEPEESDFGNELDPHEQTLSAADGVNLDEGDVLAEADFHMAYGLYDQAAELVTKALRTQPERRDLKLKLLEVFFVWGNKDAFLEAARDLREDIGEEADADWDKIIIMGKQMWPDDPLFAGATSAGGAVDVDLAGGTSPALDFELGGEESFGDVDLEFGVATESDLDLEMDGTQDLQRTQELRRAGDETDAAERLDIGSQTAANIEHALLLDDEETGRKRKQGDEGDTLSATDASLLDPDAFAGQAREFEVTDVDATAATQESPTVETPWAKRDADADSPTMGTPTVESSRFDEPTMESPTVESPAGRSAEPTGTVELPTVEQPRFAAAENADPTAEISLDDLGLDLDDLDALTGTSRERAGETLTLDSDGELEADDILSATGVTAVITSEDSQTLRPVDDDDAHVITGTIEDQDATLLAPNADDHEHTFAGTEVLAERVQPDEEAGNTSLVRSLGADFDVNLDELPGGEDVGETIEQPRDAALFTRDVFGVGNGATPLDLDVGFDGDEQDPHTMTEVGTKLDLARAYIDMGDPEGARSILEEVLDEGDPGQREEAQTLMQGLGG